MPIVKQMGGNILAFRMAIDAGLAKSRSAMLIWNWLQQPGRDYDVLVLPPGVNFGQMLTESDASSDDAVKGRQQYALAFHANVIPRPVVLWNATYEFDYFGDVEGVEMNATGDIKPVPASKAGGYVLVTPRKGFAPLKTRVIRVTAGKMPPWLVLFHELGHVKQYFEAGGEAGWKVRLGDTNQIEADNLNDHEYPICRDLRIPVRAHYKHNVFGFEAVMATYSKPTTAGAWKSAPDIAARATLETALKGEADANGLAPKATGIYHAPGP